MIEYKVDHISYLNEEYLNNKAKLGYKLISVVKNEDGLYFLYTIVWSVEDGKIEESE